MVAPSPGLFAGRTHQGARIGDEPELVEGGTGRQRVALEGPHCALSVAEYSKLSDRELQVFLLGLLSTFVGRGLC